ncbi:MAG: response regulator [Negativicutes bacterium]
MIAGRIVLVDDEKELMLVLTDLLTGHGYKVLGVTSAREALDCIKTQEFDLLITDLMMPEMDGVSLLKESLKVNPELLGIIMTGQGTVNTAVDAMKSGALDYILKPFKLNTLLPVLARAMEVSRLRKENLQLRETISLLELSRVMSFGMDLKTVLNKLADAVQEQCDAEELSIMLPIECKQELYVALVRGEGREELLGQKASVSQGIAGWVARNQEPVFLEGEVHDQRFTPLKPRKEIRSAVSMPMIVGGKVVGVINVNSRKKNKFSLGQTKALELFASTAATIIARFFSEDALERACDDREQAKVEADNANNILYSVIEYATAPIIVWTSDLSITRFNKAFENLSGYAADEVIGQSLSLLFPDGGWTQIVTMRGSQRGLLWESTEIPYRHKNGAVRVALWNSANIYAADGVTSTGVIAQGMDITERVHREQELRHEAQLARRVQDTLLSAPEASEYLNITTVYQPLNYIGGDLFFLDWRYGGGLLRGFLVDATGQGLGTALHTAALHVLLREVNVRDLPLADAMRWLNHRTGEYFTEGICAGALGFELDLETRQLRWVCAGIPEVWMFTKTQQGVVQCPGMCLGILGEKSFDTHTMTMDVGDSFYFMTDGLSDGLELQTALPLGRYPEMVGLLQTLSKSDGRRDDASAICIHVCALPKLLVRQDGWPKTLRFNGYGDYQRLKGEIVKIVAEVTGMPHSFHEVAVNEALANAMECRDGVPRQHKARLRFNKIGHRLIVRVKTSRMGFAGNAILRRLRSHPEDMFSFGEDAAMGRGIPMMLSMSHRMIYNNEGTEVLLAWKLQ